MMKTVIKYLFISLVGAVGFVAANSAATVSRGYDAIGGEVFFIILPVLWWIAERAARDIKRDIKIFLEEMKND